MIPFTFTDHQVSNARVREGEAPAEPFGLRFLEVYGSAGASPSRHVAHSNPEDQ